MLIQELLYLMTHNEEFIDAIGNRNYEKDKVRNRFKILSNSLNEITGIENNKFSLKLKQEIYDKNPECCDCNKRIQSIDDGEIYGVKYYWREEMIPYDARLIHRYCNLSETPRY